MGFDTFVKHEKAGTLEQAQKATKASPQKQYNAAVAKPNFNFYPSNPMTDFGAADTFDGGDQLQGIN